MKKIIALSLLFVSLFAVPVVAETSSTQNRWEQRQDDYRRDRRDRRNRGRGRVYPRYRNYSYTVVNEQRYVRVMGRVYREVYRSTYDPYGRLVRRVLIRRERISRYDRYNDRDFRNNGIRFNIFFRF